MDIQAVCRVCLADSIKMHEVTNLQLQEVYEKLTDINAKMGIDERPITLCYICYSQLKRCCQFLKAARRSESILTQLYHRTIELTSVVDRPPIYSYSITPIEHVSVYEPITEGIEKLVQDFKKEIFEVADETKLPELPDVVKSDPDIDLHSDAEPSIPSQSSDSEDDLPLTNFKKDKARQKRIYKKRSKLDAREVLVPKEQQIQDVLSRATSLNYLNSPHRCALCYRGFLNHDAFRNHQAKHDKRSGAHECDVCRLRYRTARLLRAHTHSAHSRRYQCNKCTHTSHTTHQAYDHEQWHNGHTYECQLCGHKFLKRTSYLTHTRKAHPSDHICNVCGERFVGRHGLLMHKSKTHNRVKEEEEKEDTSPREDRFCSSCDIQFLTLDAWKRHIITSIKHTLQTQQSGTCLICRAYVPHGAAEHMRSHVRRSRPHTDTQTRTHTDTQARTHAGEAELHCEQCPQTFLNKAKLTAHVRRVHLGLKYNKNIVCEVCGKKCTSNATLKYHQRTHTGERPHPCATCGKRFSDTNQLRIHSRTHTGEKPYSCQHCSKRFAQKPALNRHYRVHTGAKPYACELCSKSFSQSNSLKVHVRAVHLKMQSYRRGRGASGNNLPGGTQGDSNK